MKSGGAWDMGCFIVDCCWELSCSDSVLGSSFCCCCSCSCFCSSCGCVGGASVGAGGCGAFIGLVLAIWNEPKDEIAMSGSSGDKGWR